MALLVAEYDALMEAKSQNEWLMEQLRLLKKKQSGASSEQTKEPLDGQMSLLFNEAEAYTAPPGPQKTTQVAAHTRKQSGSVKDAVPDNIPVEVVEHRLPEEERVCPQCGERMREIGTEVRETLKLIPAKAILRKDVYYTYACENCEKMISHAHHESTERAVCDSRQLRLGGGHRPYHDAKIRDGQPTVPAGAGMGAAGFEAVPADHVQLGAAGRGSSAAGV